MNFEIEKKYCVNDFNSTLEALKRDFGKYKLKNKTGFWFANNFSGMETIIDIDNPKFFKKDVSVIKEIGEFELQEMDFQYARLRVVNNNKFVLTFKIKNLVNSIEQNTEYEYEIDYETFIRIANYLKEKALVFYYNIKESYEFTKDGLKIELSKFNDLKDAYIEVELTGNNEEELVKKLEKELTRFKDYSIKEETRSYMELSRFENRNNLKNVKLATYSKDAIRELTNITNSSQSKIDK